MKEILEKQISSLKLNQKIKNILSQNSINTIYKLCNNSRLELSSIGLTNEQINQIIIILELQGLDLKRNHAKKNSNLEKIECS